MFSYAARTILSKTLQRILQKYLVDVNIDEVALGGESGWGVVIKNVEFREGAVLFSFPVPSSDQGNSNSDNNSHTANNTKKDLDVKKVPPSGNAKDPSIPATSLPKDFNIQQAQDEEETPLKAKQLKYPGTLEKTIKHDRIPNGATNNNVQNEPQAPQQSKVPVQSTSPFCFYRRSFQDEDQQSITSDNFDEDLPQKSPTSEAEPLKDVKNSLSAEEEGEEEKKEGDLKKSNNSNPNKYENNFAQTPKNADKEQQVEQERIIELRMGKGGIIGNLGIRLMGNDRHISVSDAFMILEVVSKPSPTVPHPPTTNDVPASAAKTASPAMAGEKKKDSSTHGESSTPPPPASENKLAKLLASLPYVFLSNIIVKIVFVDYDDEHGETESSHMNVEFNRNRIVELGIGSFTIVDDSNDDSDSESCHSEIIETVRRIPICSSKQPEQKSTKKSETFIRKRLKLGMDSEKGFWVNIHPPSSHPMFHVNKPMDPSWARCVWESSSKPFFHLCGVDFLCRIYSELIVVDSAHGNGRYLEYDALTLNSTLGGNVDYIPDIFESDDDEPEEKNEENLKMEFVKSNFHRIAMGMRRCPPPYTSPHTDDDSCWSNGRSTPNNCSKDEIDMDGFIPSPGVVIFFSVYDPLEFNVERQNIEAITKLMNLMSIYNKHKSKGSEAQSTNENNQITPKQETTAATIEQYDDDDDVDVDGSSFPSYMNAQNILVFGFQIASIAINIQLMKENALYENGHGFGFCELLMHSISMDCQLLNSSLLSINDCAFDIGQIECNIYKGVCRTQHIAVGKTSLSNEKPSCIPARKTASSLLKTAAFLNTYEFYDNMNGAFQFRSILSQSGTGNKSNLKGINELKTFEIKLGQLNMRIINNMIGNLTTVSKVVQSMLFPGPSKPSSPSPLPPEFTWKYFFTLDGGVVMYENVKIELPPSQIISQKSPTVGFLMESILNQIQLKVSSELKGCARGKGFLKNMVNLPENVRMRIFLFLDDLKPLTTAFGIKNTPRNNFLGCYTINKYLSTIVDQVSMEDVREKVKKNNRESRRQALLARLMRLDNETLEEMFSAYEKKINS